MLTYNEAIDRMSTEVAPYRRLKSESFTDQISRIYYLDHKDENLNHTLVRNITFQVTDACNLACTYCYQINKGTRVMSLDVAKKFIDTLYEDPTSKEYEGAIIEFIGGEPLLQAELMDQIMDYWVHKGLELNHKWARQFMISISTNGTLYFDPVVFHFVNKWKSRLAMSFSIDGNQDLHDACRVYPDGRGSYEDAVKAALYHMKVFGKNIGTKMTIAPENVIYLYDAIVNLFEIGYKYINANCVYEQGWNIEHAKIYYLELKRLADFILDTNQENKYLSLFTEYNFHPMSPYDNNNWCGGNGQMISVDPDGYIYPCIRYMESSLGTDIDPIRCGDINTGIDYDVLNKMMTITRRSQSTDECFYCPISQGCSWCTAYNYQIFGTINKRATYICCMHKAASLANDYYWNKLYRKHGIHKRFHRFLSDQSALEIIDQDELDMLDQLELTEEESDVELLHDQYEKYHPYTNVIKYSGYSQE